MFGEVKVEARLSLRENTEGRIVFFILKHMGPLKDFNTGTGMIIFGFYKYPFCSSKIYRSGTVLKAEVQVIFY